MAFTRRQNEAYTAVVDVYRIGTPSTDTTTKLVKSPVASNGYTKVYSDVRCLWCSKLFNNTPGVMGQTQADNFFTLDEFKFDATAVSIRNEDVIVLKSDGGVTYSPTKQFVVNDQGRVRQSRGGRIANDVKVRAKFTANQVAGV